MATTTTFAPPARPTPAGPAAAKQAAPEGAARMQTWYIDAKGQRRRVVNPVPVNADNERTPHVRHVCKKSGCKQDGWILPKGKRKFCPDHGEALAAGEDRSGRGKVLAREVLALHGASALPWVALVALAVAAAVVQKLDVNAWRLALTAPAGYTVGHWVGRVWLRGRKLDPKELRRRSRRLGAHLALALLWLAVAAAGPALVGWPGNLQWLALVAGWWVQVHPWWKQVDARRARPTAPVVVPLEIEAGPRPLDPTLQAAVDTWARLIGKPGGVLGDTYLTDLRLLPAVAAGGPARPRKANLTATVRSAIPGAVNMRESRPRLLGSIATAFGVSYGDVSFAADPNDLSIAYVRVCPDNPLAEVRHYAGPDADDWRRGWSTVGWFDDGERLIYRWWTEIGAVHTLISGCTGSGKSELVVQLILRSLHSNGLVMDWLGDPQGGQSYGAVKEQVAWFAPSKTEIRLMLVAAMKEMDRRTKYLSENYIKTWRSTVDMPLLVITLDEVQKYIDDAPIVEMIQNLVGQGRKAGIALRLITQVPASYALGGTIYIKEQLLSGQTFTFRAETGLAGRHASEGDDMVDPVNLPKRWGKWTCGEGKTTAGLCFVRGVDGRDLFARVDYTGEDMLVWLVDADGNSTATPGQMSPEALAVAGVLWTGRHDRARLTMSGARDDRSLLNSTNAEALIAEAEALAAAGYDPSKVLTTDNASGAGLVARDLVHRAAAEAANDNAGIATRQAVIDLTPDMATSTRDGAIGDLVAGGVLERVKNGQYRLLRWPTPAAVSATATPTGGQA